MPYRLYVITSPGYRTVPLDLSCATDASALAYAETMVRPDRSIEVWDHCRLVGEVGPVFPRPLPMPVFKPRLPLKWNAPG